MSTSEKKKEGSLMKIIPIIVRIFVYRQYFFNLHHTYFGSRPPKVTQQQILDEFSDLDPQSNFNITSSSTTIELNLLTTNANNYQYITTDPSQHVSFCYAPKHLQMCPLCHRCNVVIYGNYRVCTSCDRC